MNLQSPTNAKAIQEVDQTFQAARVVLRPHDFRGPGNAHVGGHYRRIFSTGALTTPVAAGGALFSCRWTNPDRALMLHRIRAWATIGTVFTTAQELSVDLARVINFTAGDTGGTSLELGDDGRKEKSHMGPSLAANVRIATVGPLTAGTGLEEAPMGGSLFAGLLNVVGSMAEARVFDVLPGLEHPAIFGRQDGFRIRNRVAFGAAGVVVMTFELDWSEIPTAFLAE
jgi:hypothetical protein